MTKEELQAHRKTRLQELAKQSGGYAALGRMLGYRDGAYIAQLCKGQRPIKEEFVNECEKLPGNKGWFHTHGESVEDLFTPELRAHLRKQTPEQIKRIENLLRAAEGLHLLR